jgi:O-methyltransferase
VYKVSSLIVDLVLSFWQRIPGPVIHNLEKARVLKKLFWHLNVDGVSGVYLEFGVAHGHSMRSAQIAEATSYSEKLGIKRVSRNLYGFDTFEKFIGDPVLDNHPTWNGDLFNVSVEKVRRRFRHAKNVKFSKLDVNTLVSNTALDYGNFEIYEKASIILFDMDLYGPTRSALEWSAGLLQQGTFLIFDEYFAFAGNQQKGEARALKEFLDKHSEFSVREFDNYGAGGKIFIVDMH